MSLNPADCQNTEMADNKGHLSSQSEHMMLYQLMHGAELEDLLLLPIANPACLCIFERLEKISETAVRRFYT